MNHCLVSFVCLGLVGVPTHYVRAEKSECGLKGCGPRVYLDFVCDAIKDGLARDGVPREFALKLAGHGSFLTRCELCWAVRFGLRDHANLPEQPQGPGLPADLAKRLQDPNDKVRWQALCELVGKYVWQRIEEKKLSKDEQKNLLGALKEFRKRMCPIAMDLKFEVCPSCDGSCLIAPPENPSSTVTLFSPAALRRGKKGYSRTSGLGTTSLAGGWASIIRSTGEVQQIPI